MRSRFKTLWQRPLFFPIIVTFIYFIINLILVLNHEAWRDEANVWQIAKSIGFDNFYETLQVEPHPALWFLILAPFAKLGLPYITTNIISLLIMTLAVFLLARYAPFSKKTKIIILLSAVFLYFNPVISRNYCLVVLGVVTVAVAYKSRLKHPVRYALALALLCQSHFLALPLAAILTITFIVDYIKANQRRHLHKIILPLAVIGASVLVSLPIILGNLAGHTLITGTPMYAGVDWLLEINRSLFSVVVPIFELTFIAAAVYLFFHHKKQLIHLLVSTTAWFIVLIFVYKYSELPIQKSSLVLLFMIFTFWAAHYDKPHRPSKLYKKLQKTEFFGLIKRVPVAALLIIPLAATIPRTVSAAVFDLTGEYSYGARFASYVNQNTPENSVIMVADSTAAGVAITFVPLLEGGRQIYDVATKSFVDFYKYDGYPELTEKDLATAISTLSSAELYYLAPLSTCANQLLPEESWELLVTFDGRTEAIESAIGLYHVSSPSSAQNKSTFSIDSIPRLDLTTGNNFDTSYGVWNTSISLKTSDKAILANNHDGLTGKIKTRGNTTYAAGEKYGTFQYKVKLDSAVDFFGFGAHKEWILLANFLDRSYLRQFFLSGMGQLIMGETYFVPQMKYVEFYINGDYQGLYLLVESIEENQNRLNIETAFDASQTEIPFLVQMENGRMKRTQIDSLKNTYFLIDSPSLSCGDYNGTSLPHTFISYEYPETSDDMTDAQTAYIKNTIAGLYRNARNGVAFDQLGIDAASFANYFVFQELMFNTGFGSSSVYYYKPLGGAITAGPLWDFDQLLMIDIGAGFTRPGTCDNTLYRYLLQYPEFRALMHERLSWVAETLNPQAEQQLFSLQNNPILRAAVERNEAKHQLWGREVNIGVFYQNPTIVSYTSWDEHVEHIRKTLFSGYEINGQTSSRATWLLANFDELR